MIGLRLLDTGTARDVSGVLRITRGGACCEDAEPDDTTDEDSDGDWQKRERVEEGEFLYYVAGDGSVKVFERGT